MGMKLRLMEVTALFIGCRSAITANSDIYIVMDSFIVYWVK